MAASNVFVHKTKLTDLFLQKLIANTKQHQPRRAMNTTHTHTHTHSELEQEEEEEEDQIHKADVMMIDRCSNSKEKRREDEMRRTKRRELSSTADLGIVRDRVWKTKRAKIETTTVTEKKANTVREAKFFSSSNALSLSSPVTETDETTLMDFESI